MYQLHEDGPAQEELDDEDLAAANHWLLPSSDFKGLWESLIFDSSIKQQVVLKLNYICAKATALTVLLYAFMVHEFDICYMHYKQYFCDKVKVKIHDMCI